MAKTHKSTKESIESPAPNMRATGYRVHTMINDFRESPRVFLDQLQHLYQTLDEPIAKQCRRESADRNKAWEASNAEYCLRTDIAFEINTFLITASETLRAWELLSQSDDRFAAFEGLPLRQLVEMIRPKDALENPKEDCEFSDFPQRFSEFEAAIAQFASRLEGSGTGPRYEPNDEQLRRVENALRDMGPNPKPNAVAKKAKMRKQWVIIIMKMIKARTE